MDIPRVVILVEDNINSYKPIKDDLQEEGWEVYRARDGEDTYLRIQQCQEQNKQIDAIAVDLGFPPGINNPFMAGIPLIEELRHKFPTLPILAYTALTSSAFSYEEAVRRLLAMRVSFLCTRQLGDRIKFSQILEFTWLGYVIISPEVADKLHYAISNKPDPLSEKQWRLLSLLRQGMSQREMAEQLEGISVGSVKVWKSEIRRILEDLNEIDYLEESERNDSELINWYLTHHVRYSRP